LPAAAEAYYPLLPQLDDDDEYAIGDEGPGREGQNDEYHIQETGLLALCHVHAPSFIEAPPPPLRRRPYHQNHHWCRRSRIAPM
jgi:hypothetical protein